MERRVMMNSESTLEAVVWAKSAPPLAPLPRLKAVERAEVAIVGAGYCGLSTALELAENGVSVAVLEAGEPGSGASGRNAGHCCPDWIFFDPDGIDRRFGKHRGARINLLQASAASLVFSLIHKHRISCGAVQSGTINVARRDRHLDLFQDRCRQWQIRGARVKHLDRHAVGKLIKTEAFAGGLLFQDGGHLNPLAFARGLAMAVQNSGGRVFANSPAVSLKQREKGTWLVEAPGGAVEAQKVVLATNAYRSDLWPGLDRSFYRIPSMGVATDPIEKELRDAILPENHNVAEHMGRNFFFRFDQDGRLCMGGVVGWNVYRDLQQAQSSLGSEFQRVFPQLGTVVFTHYWRGLLDISPNRIVGVHELAQNLFAVVGFSGRGVPTATAVGQDLAQMIIADSPDAMAFPLTPLPRALLGQAGAMFLTHVMLPARTALRRNS